MEPYVARRVKFTSGERTSVLVRRSTGMPVHEAVLFVNTYRTRGRAANTIHQVVRALAIFHGELDRANVSILDKLKQAQFLSSPEMHRLVDRARLQVHEPDDAQSGPPRAKVIRLDRIMMRPTRAKARAVVEPATQAFRIRVFAAYLQFLAEYVAAGLPASKADRLTWLTRLGQKHLRSLVPSVHQRGRIGARIGLSVEEQARLCQTVDLSSPLNPWKNDYVRRRNRLIVNLLLATGMRRGELLNLQIRDIDPRNHTLRILRRPDDPKDPRRVPPNAKTHAREIKLMPSISRELLHYIDVDRHAIRSARTSPHIFVSDDGSPLSLSSIDKIFKELRAACPGMPVQLTSHVMRHTWNERFSEVSEKMGLSEVEEQRARANQQGWSETSNSAAVYTRRHTERKGREAALKLQENLEGFDDEFRKPAE